MHSATDSSNRLDNEMFSKMEQNIAKTATNMLEQQLDLKLIASVTGLTNEQLIKIKNKMHLLREYN